MASTQITVENRTLILIKVAVLWGDKNIPIHVGSVDIQPRPEVKAPAPSGNIPCEYVWYDLKITDSSGRLLSEKQVKGGTSWIFEGASLDPYGPNRYRLWEHPGATPPIIEQGTHH
jgi:hypothetical protein